MVDTEIKTFILNGKQVDLEKPEPAPIKPMPMSGWKTISIAATILLSVLTSPDLQDIISEYPKSFTTMMTILIVFLRVLTTTSVFTKE